jgi:hypothetical protein
MSNFDYEVADLGIFVGGSIIKKRMAKSRIYIYK